MQFGDKKKQIRIYINVARLAVFFCDLKNREVILRAYGVVMNTMSCLAAFPVFTYSFTQLD